MSVADTTGHIEDDVCPWLQKEFAQCCPSLLPCSLHMLILCSVGVMGMAPFGEWEGLGQLQDMVEQR